MRLLELQQAFQHRVLHGDRGIESEVSAPDNGNFHVETRLGIYENAFIGRLVEALAVTYPAMRDSLGHAEFAALTRSLVARAPPAHFSVRYFGGDLETFVATHWNGVKAQVLQDLARWEWALGEVFDAADAAPLSPADLSAFAPERWGDLRFQLTPALRILSVRTNAVQWWRASTQGASRPTRWRTAAPVTWALCRTQLKTYFRSLQKAEEWAIGAAADGKTFAFVCDGLTQYGDDAEAPTRAAVMLHRWLSDGWIVGIDSATGDAGSTGS